MIEIILIAMVWLTLEGITTHLRAIRKQNEQIITELRRLNGLESKWK